MFETSFILDFPAFHMWAVFVMIVAAILLYANDKIALELSSIAILSALLLLFAVFPMLDDQGVEKVTVHDILRGFSNPALVAMLSLLVIGQAVVQTGALNEITALILRLSRNNALFSIVLTLVVVMVISAFLNNTPVVVIFIPILSALAKSLNVSVSNVMMPLSYAAIIGGMTTLIGSSTNLLVSGTLQNLGYPELGFFDFSIPGLVLASVGLAYIVFIAPRFLPDRAGLAASLVGDDERQFIAQMEIDAESDFIGQKLETNSFADFPDVTVRMIQRGEHAFLPPFEEEMDIRENDVLVIAATRRDLTDILSKRPDSLIKEFQKSIDDSPEEEESSRDINLTEVVVAPASRIIGQTLEQIGFRSKYKCVVLGIQRQSRVIRARITEIRLQPGDVLLVMGSSEDIYSLKETNDMLLMEWSTEEIHSGSKATRVTLIFGTVVGLAALDILPISITALVGSTIIIFSGALNIRQALRALDTQIVFMVAASLALGTALEATGGASYISHGLVELMHGASPTIIMSAFFILMVCLTSVLSNNASAVLFTPIALGIAAQLNVDPRVFIFAVIFACNCSFMTPIGYQTNLLVMAPGHYKFSDFMRAGVPLSIILWLTYSFFAPWYFGL